MLAQRVTLNVERDRRDLTFRNIADNTETFNCRMLTQESNYIDSIKNDVQKHSCTLVNNRRLFEGVIKKFIKTKSKLVAIADIVEHTGFQSAVLIVRKGQEDLTKKEVKTLEVPGSTVEGSGNGDRETEHNVYHFVNQIMTKRKLSRETAYMDSRYNLCTWNICERVISKAGCVLNYRQEYLSTASFETQLRLHVNRRF